eukprot:m.42339 g.42339  ORF g.42339 m.42339 type:complete len:54 (-) comp19078_c0_seq1:105-266(-)
MQSTNAFAKVCDDGNNNDNRCTSEAHTYVGLFDDGNNNDNTTSSAPMQGEVIP